MYEIELSKEATKFIKKQDKKTQKRLRDAILSIAEDPFTVTDVKKLQDKEYLRKRVGDFRIAYEIKRDQVLIYIVSVGNRGDFYKRL